MSPPLYHLSPDFLCLKHILLYFSIIIYSLYPLLSPPSQPPTNATLLFMPINSFFFSNLLYPSAAPTPFPTPSPRAVSPLSIYRQNRDGVLLQTFNIHPTYNQGSLLSVLSYFQV